MRCLAENSLRRRWLICGCFLPISVSIYRPVEMIQRLLQLDDCYAYLLSISYFLFDCFISPLELDLSVAHCIP